MKSLISFLTFIFCLQTSLTAQNFERAYPFYTEAFADAVFTQDDGYLSAFASRKDKFYLSLIKTDLYGDTLWTKDHDLGLTSMGNTVGTQDSEGNIYLTADMGSQNLVKIDQNGNILWSKYYQFTKQCLELNNGFLWMATYGCYLYKLDAATGDSLWRSDPFGNTYNYGIPTSLAFLDDGNIVITAHMYSLTINTPSTDFYKFDPNTNSITKFELDTDIKFVIRDSEGVGNEIWSIGNLFSYNNPTHNAYFIRYSADGDIILLAEHIFDYYSGFRKLLVKDNNEIVILGSAFYTNPSYYNTILYFMTAEGETNWTTILGNEDHIPVDLQKASDGGYLIGSAIKDQFDHVQPYLLKTDSLGLITSVSDLHPTFEFSIYPNPAHDYLTIESPGIISGTISLFNSYGQKCREIAINNERSTIAVQNLNKGIYFCIINSGSAYSCKTIILGP